MIVKPFCLAVILLALSGFGLAACGSGDSGTGCSEVCSKVGECGTSEDEQECLEGCNDLKDLFRDSAWDNAAACIMDTPCGDDFNPDMCLMQAGEDEPDSLLDDLAETVCTRLNECDDQVNVENCKTEFKSNQGAGIVKAFKDSVHDCIGECVNGESCDDLAGGLNTVMGPCMCECGILMACD